MLDVQKVWLTPTQSLDFVPEWYGPGYGMHKPKSVDGIYLFEISDGEISYLSTWYATKRKPLRGRDIPHALHDSAGAP